MAYRMLLKIVPANRKFSCSTTPIWLWNFSSTIFLMSTPSTNMAPSSTSYKCMSRLIMVDFPVPEAPTRPIISPFDTFKFTSSSTGW